MKPIPIRRAISRAAVLVAASGVAFTSLAIAGYAQPVDDTGAASIRSANTPNSVPGRYIVVFQDQTGIQAVTDLTRRHGGKVRHTYDSALRGYSAEMTEQQARAVAADPAVAYVEQAQKMTIADTQTNPPNWGADRIDQRDLPLDKAFTYPSDPGKDVHVYVLDTGLNANHTDFTGRVGSGYDFVDNDSTPADCHSHGTHVAGTAAGSTYGIAKKATVHAVRVLNCLGNGSNDDIIAGIDWVKNNATKPAVVNYSIGCGQRCSSSTMDNTVKSLISSGVQFVQAAGNSNDDACYYSPQLVPEAITVGATKSNDERPTDWNNGQGSNYGTCLDIFAPGDRILSASHSSNTGSTTKSGTSMASPQVAGAAAVWLAQNPNGTPAQLRDALVDNSTTGKLTNIGTGSPNQLLYTGFMNGSTGVTVTNPGDQSTKIGAEVNLQIKASSSDNSALTFSATGLPDGLSISSSGLITGKPTTAGKSLVKVTAKDSANKTGDTSFNWTVTSDQGGKVTVTNPGDQWGFTGWEIWPVQMKASSTAGGALTFTASGLPAGLSISSSGLITGTPSQGGEYTVTVTATDSGGSTGTTTFGWRIFG